MKLLSPKEIKDSKDEDIVRKTLRLQTINEALKNAQNELNNADARFNMALANQKIRWTREENEATERLKALTDEVSKFEERIKVALIPIDQARNEAHNLLKEAKDKKEEVDVLLDLLQDRLDSLSDRELAVSLREQKVFLKEQGVEGQAKMIKHISKDLFKKNG